MKIIGYRDGKAIVVDEQGERLLELAELKPEPLLEPEPQPEPETKLETERRRRR